MPPKRTRNTETPTQSRDTQTPTQSRDTQTPTQSRDTQIPPQAFFKVGQKYLQLLPRVKAGSMSEKDMGTHLCQYARQVGVHIAEGDIMKRIAKIGLAETKFENSKLCKYPFLEQMVSHVCRSVVVGDVGHVTQLCLERLTTQVPRYREVYGLGEGKLPTDGWMAKVGEVSHVKAGHVTKKRVTSLPDYVNSLPWDVFWPGGLSRMLAGVNERAALQEVERATKRRLVEKKEGNSNEPIDTKSTATETAMTVQNDTSAVVIDDTHVSNVEDVDTTVLDEVPDYSDTIETDLNTQNMFTPAQQPIQMSTPAQPPQMIHMFQSQNQWPPSQQQMQNMFSNIPRGYHFYPSSSTAQRLSFDAPIRDLWYTSEGMWVLKG